MHLLRLLNRQLPLSIREFGLVLLLTGLANTLMIVALNAAAKLVLANQNTHQYFFIFIISTTLYLLCLRYLFFNISYTFKGVIKNVRVNFVNGLNKISLRTLEKIGHEKLYTKITKATETISQNEVNLVFVLESCSLLLFVNLYFAYQSVLVFILLNLVLTPAIWEFLQHYQKSKQYIEHSKNKEMESIAAISNIIKGFKEIKTNTLRSEEIVADFENFVEDTREQQLKSSHSYYNVNLFGRVIVFAIIGLIVFVFPQITDLSPQTILQVFIAFLFCRGALTVVAYQISNLISVNLAAKDIFELEQYLQENSEDFLEQTQSITDFDSITLKDLYFSYDSQETFAVGPINMKIEKGKIYFITGKNGSGKSTFLKLMTLLYSPTKGSILLNNNVIHENQIQNYRELYSVLFGDFHIFSKLYGIENKDESVIQEMLKLMQLEEKTSYQNNQFTNTDLSTGQRKRLGLIITMLEDRPIYVFDEWAAEQDPEFRKYFYENFLPKMKQQNKTVIAVTHDDRYFDAADHIIRFREGKMSAY